MLRKIILTTFFLISVFSSEALYGTAKEDNLAELFQRLINTKTVPTNKAIDEAALKKVKAFFDELKLESRVYNFTVQGPHAQAIHEQIVKGKRDPGVLQTIRTTYESTPMGKKLTYLEDQRKGGFPEDLLIHIAASPAKLYSEAGTALGTLIHSDVKANSHLLTTLMSHIDPLAEHCAQFGGKQPYVCNEPKAVMFRFNQFNDKQQQTATAYSLAYTFFIETDKLYKTDYNGGALSTGDLFPTRYISALGSLKELTKKEELAYTLSQLKFSPEQVQLMTELQKSGQLPDLLKSVLKQ